jgi:hypothetical protein
MRVDCDGPRAGRIVVRGSSRSGGYHKRRSGDQRRLTRSHTPRSFDYPLADVKGDGTGLTLGLHNDLTAVGSAVVVRKN